MSVKPGSKRWKELVEQGLAVTSGRNWFIGDAALEIAPMTEHGTNQWTMKEKAGGALHDLLEMYAEEVGLQVQTLVDCRKVSSAWPVNKRVNGTSWFVHKVLMSKDVQHLVKSGLTSREAEALGGRAPRPNEVQRDERLEEAVNKATAFATAKAVEAAERQHKLALKQVERNFELEAKKAEKMAAEREKIAAKTATAKAEQQAMLKEREIYQKAEEEKAKAVSAARTAERQKMKEEEKARHKEAAKAAEAARARMNEEERREFDSDVAQYLRAQRTVADSRFAMKATDYQRHISQSTKINDKHTTLAIESVSSY